MAFRYGPGGPINALVGTQVIYQTLLNAIVFDQGLSHFQFYGITAGVIATIVISSGDEILNWIKCSKSIENQKSESVDQPKDDQFK